MVSKSKANANTAVGGKLKNSTKLRRQSPFGHSYWIIVTKDPYRLFPAKSHDLSATTYTVMSLEVCYRCGANTDCVYACEHTNERKLCIECYQFIHWAINNNSDGRCINE